MKPVISLKNYEKFKNTQEIYNHIFQIISKKNKGKPPSPTTAFCSNFNLLPHLIVNGQKPIYAILDSITFQIFINQKPLL